VIDDNALATWFKRIRIVHELDRKQVVEIMRLGGTESGRRLTVITEREFDAFLTGLVEWTSSPR
jgi:hypothetical protein